MEAVDRKAKLICTDHGVSNSSPAPANWDQNRILYSDHFSSYPEGSGTEKNTGCHKANSASWSGFPHKRSTNGNRISVTPILYPCRILQRYWAVPPTSSLKRTGILKIIRLILLQLLINGKKSVRHKGCTDF